MNRLFSLSACNMGLGLAHLRLTSQMRCSHLAVILKFSAKNITYYAKGVFTLLYQPISEALSGSRYRVAFWVLRKRVAGQSSDTLPESIRRAALALVAAGTMQNL